MDGTARDESQRVKRMLCQQLQSLEGAGVKQLPKIPFGATKLVADMTASNVSPHPRATGESSTSVRAPHTSAVTNPSVPLETSPAMAKAKTPVAAVPPSEPFGPKLNRGERLTVLDVMRTEVAACRKCSELATTRTQTVFGVGNIEPRVCFFGEAPGADEDEQGEPFVGRAGQLLNKIIEASQMKREDVYILNTLKCRPPGNRTPAIEEVANCRHFFERQLEALRPEYLVCLGSVAAQSLLNTTLTIGKLRGRFHDYRGIKVLATYHPAYLLRNPNAKKDVWEDMKILMRDMGLM